jgi:hypothetical protein
MAGRYTDCGSEETFHSIFLRIDVLSRLEHEKLFFELRLPGA